MAEIDIVAPLEGGAHVATATDTTQATSTTGLAPIHDAPTTSRDVDRAAVDHAFVGVASAAK